MCVRAVSACVSLTVPVNYAARTVAAAPVVRVGLVLPAWVVNASVNLIAPARHVARTVAAAHVGHAAAVHAATASARVAARPIAQGECAVPMAAMARVAAAAAVNPVSMGNVRAHACPTARGKPVAPMVAVAPVVRAPQMRCAQAASACVCPIAQAKHVVQMAAGAHAVRAILAMRVYPASVWRRAHLTAPTRCAATMAAAARAVRVPAATVASTANA